MNSLWPGLTRWFTAWSTWWDALWFTAAPTRLPALLRVMAGSLIFYTHLVWSLELRTFFGRDGVLPVDYRQLLGNGRTWAWSHFDWLPSDQWLWPVHIAGLAVMLAFAAGLWTRATSILTALLVISYANRATGALFGLDQINGMLSIYLALTPCGEWLGIDAWRKRRQGRGVVQESVLANIGLRLIQIHLCVIYLFAGLGKLQGQSWWNGQALWGAVASYEYQTLDLTFLAGHMAIVNVLTWATVAWETSYPFLVWPRLTRPLMLGMAFVVHLGIGLAMGMMTFGLAMIIANLAFLPPEWFARPAISGQSSAGQRR